MTTICTYLGADVYLPLRFAHRRSRPLGVSHSDRPIAPSAIHHR
jgi:hypothetical protein